MIHEHPFWFSIRPRDAARREPKQCGISVKKILVKKPRPWETSFLSEETQTLAPQDLPYGKPFRTEEHRRGFRKEESSVRNTSSVRKSSSVRKTLPYGRVFRTSVQKSLPYRRLFRESLPYGRLFRK